MVRIYSGAEFVSLWQMMMQIKPVAASAGQQTYTTAGATGTWTVPAGVTSICVVCVGAGGDGLPSGSGGGGGALAYSNNISVTPGESLSYQVGTRSTTATADSYLKRGATTLVLADGASTYTQGNAASSTGFATYSGGAGGVGNNCCGGGGAAGYAGAGGAGGSGGVGSSGSGGGGGGGGGDAADYDGAGGGGVGYLGQGSSGAGGDLLTGGSGGSGGGSGGNAYDGSTGGSYGGGGGGGYDTGNTHPGAGGFVRIIWGAGRSYPSTNTGDV